MTAQRLFGWVALALRRWLPWLVGGALSIQLFYTDFTHSDGGELDGKAFWGRDFVNLWTGGRLLREHGAGWIYEVEPYRAFLASLFGPLKPHNYSYPPVTFPLAELFSFLPYGLALVVWLLSTGLLFAWAARSWWSRQWGPSLFALLTPAALMNIWAGHYGFLIGALFLLGWANLEERPVRAGIFFGLMLVKPHLAVLIPLVLALRRQWSAFAAAAATVALLVLVTALAYGLDPWLDFLFGTSATQAGLIDAGGSFYGYMSTSLATAILRFSDDLTIALGAQLALAAAAVAMLVVAARRSVSTADLAMLTATATFLVLPYGFNYDLTVVCIAALRLSADPRSAWPERWAAVIGFIAPQVGMYLAPRPLALPATPVMLAVLFLGQFAVAIRSSGRKAAGDTVEATGFKAEGFSQ